MTLLKALLPLAALLLLSVVPTETKVVNSIADCKGFLLNDNPPNIPGILEGGKIQDQNRYKPICQTLTGARMFVTLYDTKNKIPVFSAAKYIGNEGNRPKNPKWMIEPQLENPNGNDNMTPAKDTQTYNHQAGDTDYKNNQRGLDRGHLLPSCYGFKENEIKSTFTLTNVVPQKDRFNQGSWNKMEQRIKCVMDKFCINNNNKIEGFVVIGTQPSTNNILNNRVNIPSMLWSAFCCYSSKEKKWLASAYWGENKEPTEEYLETKTLKDLHKKLGGKSEVFPGSQCPLTTTVANLYPKLDPKCDCPPPDTTLTPTAPPGVLSNMADFLNRCRLMIQGHITSLCRRLLGLQMH